MDNMPGGINGENASSPMSESPDTLTEPISRTVLRDLNRVWKKLEGILHPLDGGADKIIQDWDLWGPLLLCLVLSLSLSIRAPVDDKENVFALMFMIVWGGSAVVTLNSKLLGSRISLFQGICVLGYCVFPLVLSSLVSLVISNRFLRAFYGIGAFCWSIYASHRFMVDQGLGEKRPLVAYPISLFYFSIAWIIWIL